MSKLIDLQGLGAFKTKLMEDVVAKPAVNGTEGQVLTADATGNPIWKDNNADLTGYAKETYVDTKVATKIAEVVNSAPETLDTLKELSDALGGDANFAATVTTNIGKKLSKPETNATEGQILTADATGNPIWANKEAISIDVATTEDINALFTK